MVSRQFFVLLPFLAGLVLAQWSGNAPSAHAANPLFTSQPLRLAITTEGIYKLTGQQLVNAGVDLTGATGSSLGLEDTSPSDNPSSVSDDSAPTQVPVYVSTTGAFTTSDYVEFYAHPAFNTYSSTNYYILTDSDLTPNQVALTTGVTAGAGTPATTGSWRLDDTRRTAYVGGFFNASLNSSVVGTNASNASIAWPSNGDPSWMEWQAALDIGLGFTTTSKTITLPIPTNLNSSGNCTLTSSDQTYQWNGSGTVNYETVVNVGAYSNPWDWTDGSSINPSQRTLTDTFPCSDFVSSSNQVTYTGNSATTTEQPMIAAINLSYSENLCAVGNQLAWQGPTPAFTIGGFSGSPDVWRIDASGNASLYQAASTSTGGCSGTSITMTDPAGTPATEYFATSAPLTPASIALLDITTPLTTGPAQYLVILGARKDQTSPFSASEFTALEAAHPNLTFKFADVNAVYDQFGYGQYDPYAIRRYIQWAHVNLGTQYVLLVGGDTWDYHSFRFCVTKHCSWSYGGTNQSLIPSFYLNAVSSVISADNLFAVPLTADSAHPAPDVALGRIPAFTSTQLDNALAKAVNFETQMGNSATTATRTALFTAGPQGTGTGAGFAFQTGSNTMMGHLTSTGTFTSANISTFYMTSDSDDEGTPFRQALQHPATGSVGPEIVNFNGHGDETDWASTTVPMLDSVNVVNASTGVAQLTNTDANTTIQPLVFQWGCAVATYEDPQTGLDSIASDLVLAPNSGASLIVGSTGEPNEAPEETLAGGFALDQGPSGNGFFYGYLMDGYTVGQALELAKDDLITEDAGNQQYLDVANSYVILGDPALDIGLSAPTMAVVTRFAAKVLNTTSTKLVWKVASNTGITGFNVYAGTKRLNAAVIPVHTSRSYHLVTTYHGKKPFVLHTLLQSGGEVTTPLTSG